MSQASGTMLGSGGSGLRAAAGSEVRLPLALAAVGVGFLLPSFRALPRHAPGRLMGHHFGRGGAEGRQPLAVVALVESGALLSVADEAGAAALGDAAAVRVEVLLRGLAAGFARLVAPGVPWLLGGRLGAAIVGAP